MQAQEEALASLQRGLTSVAVLDQFEDTLPRLWAWSKMEVDDPAKAAGILRRLIQCEGPCSRGAARFLVESGIRIRWNEAFALHRAHVVAEWVAPHLTAPLLDVLAGDLSVTRQLVMRGLAPITATERLAHYQEYLYHDDIELLDHPDHGDLPGQASSVLMCTVLHHEPEPRRLLDRIAEKQVDRWVIVENCLELEYGGEFHTFMDLFFNSCLNNIGIPCVDEHRTSGEWRGLFANYGKVVLEDARWEVPGIPFPYRMFVIAR
jgi:hypothetical protein